jgi:uncharacterized protein (DUF488 family)
MAVRTAYTIGFAQRRADDFFETLRQAGIRRLVDIRLNNVSQLAGFTKRQDLPYFLKAICGIEYVHELSLAPTPAMLNAYRHKRITWDTYAEQYLALLRERKVEATLPPSLLDVPTVFLCSERKSAQCHRRLAVEYLQKSWGGEIVHL